MLRLRAALMVPVMIIGSATLMSGRFGATTLARVPSPSSASAYVAAECEGDACSQVSVTFDESKQQYRAVNNSTEHWARVTASNMAASASACLAPGKEAYLPMKSITGAYHAVYAEIRCGEEAASGPPSGE